MATSGQLRVRVTPYNDLVFKWKTKSQSMPDNKSTVEWSLELVSGEIGSINSIDNKAYSITVNGVSYTGTNKINIDDNETKILKAGTTEIVHNANGKKVFEYTFSQEFSITYEGVLIGTKNGRGLGSLDPFERGSTLTVENGTLGTHHFFTIERRVNTAKHQILYKCGEASGYVEGTSDTFLLGPTFTWKAPLSLAAEYPTQNSVQIWFELRTYTGDGELIESSYQMKNFAVPSSVKPAVHISVSDPTGLFDIYGGFVRSVSKFQVDLTYTLGYGSKIIERSALINGNTYRTDSFTTDFLKNAGEQIIEATAKDARGRTGAATKNITVLDYERPNVSIKVKRCKSLTDGTEDINSEFAQVTFSSEIISLSGKNTATYKLEYRKNNSESNNYIVVNLTEYDGQLTVNNGVYRFPADSGSSYTVRLTVADRISKSVKVIALSTARVIEHWGADGKSFGLGKIAEIEGGLDVGFPTRFFGGIIHPILEIQTDLNDIKTPNIYISLNIENSNYANCPLSNGSFALEVEGCGNDGQLRQKVISCRKTDSRTFERFYFDGAWGTWICTSNYAGTLLWSGNNCMTAADTVKLFEPIAAQKSGIVLIFESSYAAHSFSFFLHKYAIFADDTKLHTFVLSQENFATLGTKSIYIRDTQMEGIDNNDAEGMANGVTYDNGAFVLKYVIGV